MNNQKHLQNALAELEQMFSENVDALHAKIEEIKSASSDTVEEKKSDLQKLFMTMKEKYQHYIALAKDSADSQKDKLAEKVEELSKKIDELQVK